MKNVNYSPITFSLRDVINDSRFIIPSFQRSVVWKDERKKEFIRTVRSGDPFGIILVKYDPNHASYQLIDGLQRISTLREYVNNRFKYLSVDDINDNYVVDLIKTDLSKKKIVSNEQYISSVKNRIKSRIFSLLESESSANGIYDELIKADGFTKDYEIKRLVQLIYDDFQESTDISNLKIMAINYTGPAHNIPNVFYNLNTGAVSLTKYETYAALWSSKLFVIKDDELIQYIMDKYQQVEVNSSLSVDYNEDSMKENGITLFEYCYAIGCMLHDEKNKCSFIMSEKNKSTDPIGFELLSLILGLNVDEADKLFVILKDAPAKFLEDLKKMIKDVMNVLSGAMKSVFLDLNNEPLNPTSSYMVYHVFMSYIKEYYCVDTKNWTVKQIDSNYKLKDFKKNVAFRCFYDVLSNYWSINRQTGDLKRNIEDQVLRHKYWKTVSYNDWEICVNEFVIDRQKITSKTLSYQNKLFLNNYYRLKLHVDSELYSLIKKEMRQDDYLFSLAQIVNSKQISDALKNESKAFASSFPVTAIGNYSVILEKGRKSKKSIYEYTKNRSPLIYTEKYKEFSNYPEESDLSEIYQSTNILNDFIRFKEDRESEFANSFIRLIKTIDS